MTTAPAGGAPDAAPTSTTTATSSSYPTPPAQPEGGEAEGLEEIRTEHRDVAEGRGPAAMSLVSALALEAANTAVNCPTPPAAAEVIEAAGDDELKAAKAELAANQKAAKAAAKRAAAKASPKTPE